MSCFATCSLQRRTSRSIRSSVALLRIRSRTSFARRARSLTLSISFGSSCRRRRSSSRTMSSTRKPTRARASRFVFTRMVFAKSCFSRTSKTRSFRTFFSVSRTPARSRMRTTTSSRSSGKEIAAASRSTSPTISSPARMFRRSPRVDPIRSHFTRSASSFPTTRRSVSKTSSSRSAPRRTTATIRSRSRKRSAKS